MESTVDWCEVNYNVTPFVAEFWNTVSGIAILISAFLFKTYQLDRHSNFVKCEAISRLQKIVKLLYVVSVGTMLFHGTLLYPFQLLDELPMIMVSIEYIRALITLSTAKTNKQVSKYIGIIKRTIEFSEVMVVVTSLVYFIDPMIQIISFHFTLKVYECILVYILYMMNDQLNMIVYTNISKKHLYKDNTCTMSMIGLYSRNRHLEEFNKTSHTRFEALTASQNDLKMYLVLKKNLQKHTKYGLMLYGGSIGIWVVENMLCENSLVGDYIKGMQLHAFWHIFSSFGIYHLSNIVLTHVRINELCKEQENAGV